MSNTSRFFIHIFLHVGIVLVLTMTLAVYTACACDIVANGDPTHLTKMNQNTKMCQDTPTPIQNTISSYVVHDVTGTSQVTL